jgi:glyoxylase-like metal-dependent hydrolase (beta-lactamase superfamily II)
MLDAPIPADNPARVPLIYPFDRVPDLAEQFPVAPGVMWMQMPLPIQLNHINIWRIDDDGGWAVVDTGMHTDATIAAWREIHSKTASQGRLTRVIATHMHPDHVGMAGWLAQEHQCRLWMTRTEYLTCRILAADTGRQAPQEALSFYRRAGWDDATLAVYCSKFGGFGKHIHVLPESYRRIVDGESIRIGANTWRVLVGTGHSPEHACLYCAELKLLISGDQVLPRISSNVSLFPTEPDANPMDDWLRSLAKIKREVPDDVLVLPSHGKCFRGLHARLDELMNSQERVHARLKSRLKNPHRAIDVFGALFGRDIPATDEHLLMMATGESLACLRYLVCRGEAQQSYDAAGVAWYTATP